MEIIRGKRKPEGDGARANRILGEGRHLDPFVLFDEYYVYPDASFPMHGHSGFEGFQYLMSGGTRYEDNHGNSGDIYKGGARRFVSGNSFEHSEVPLSRETVRGYLLWVVLPREKREEVFYHQISQENIKRRIEGDMTTTFIISPTKGLDSHSEVDMKLMEGSGENVVEIGKGESGFVYLSRGDLSVEGTLLVPGSAAVLEVGDHELEYGGDTELVTVKAKRSGLDFIQEGGFVRLVGD